MDNRVKQEKLSTDTAKCMQFLSTYLLSIIILFICQGCEQTQQRASICQVRTGTCCQKRRECDENT